MHQPHHTNFRFKKAERLNRKGIIRNLFERGYSFNIYPFKVIYMKQEPAGRFNQVLISVPRKGIRKVADRNKIKRRIREAYRQNKHLLDGSKDTKYYIAYIYIANERLGYGFIDDKLKSSLLRLTNQKDL